MRRTFITEAQNKLINDWTLPKMLEIAKEEQKKEEAFRKELADAGVKNLKNDEK